MPNDRMTGTIDRMPLQDNKPRDFTFIKGDDGNSYFLHISEFRKHWKKLIESLPVKVTFTPGEGKKGKKALDVDFVEG